MRAWLEMTESFEVLHDAVRFSSVRSRWLTSRFHANFTATKRPTGFNWCLRQYICVSVASNQVIGFPSVLWPPPQTQTHTYKHMHTHTSTYTHNTHTRACLLTAYKLSCQQSSHSFPIRLEATSAIFTFCVCVCVYANTHNFFIQNQLFLLQSRRSFSTCFKPGSTSGSPPTITRSFYLFLSKLIAVLVQFSTISTKHKLPANTCWWRNNGSTWMKGHASCCQEGSGRTV